MYKILELLPVGVPILGAVMLYKYRTRLTGVLGIAGLAVVMALSSGVLGLLGDRLLFIHDSAHGLEEMLALGRNISLAAAWLCLVAAASKNRKVVK